MEFYNSENSNEMFKAILKRKKRQSLSLYPAVTEIIEDVIECGDAAIRKYSLKFDGIAPTALQISKEMMKKAYDQAEVLYIEALQIAIDNITKFHTPQQLKSYEIVDGNCYMGQKVSALNRVGIYVPGGEAAYPSTLLMNVIPAMIAGVKEIVVATPPQKDEDKLQPLLVAAYMLDINEFYLVGGVQAIAALTYGTETIKSVDKITGPGNQYVTAAKKIVYGDVAIDMIAGPSEVLIISDGSSPLKFIVADFLAQLEHDAEAMAILLTTSQNEVENIEAEILKQVNVLVRKDNVTKALEKNSFILKCNSLQEMVSISNRIAPEHLELLLGSAEEVIEDITNAGAVFIGGFTPEALGDYIAGPNHTLPTTGSARYASPLGTYDFQKRMNYLFYDENELIKASPFIDIFTKKERLEAHGKAVKIRL
ncbi:histidinol dehydrogenase [Fusibacter bizertensis]